MLQTLPRRPQPRSDMLSATLAAPQLKCKTPFIQKQPLAADVVSAMRHVFTKLHTQEARTCCAFQAGTSNHENRDMLEIIRDTSSGDLVSLKPPIPVAPTGNAEPALPPNMVQSCTKIFNALRALAISALISLDGLLGLPPNTLPDLCRVGDSDMLRIAQYTGGGRDLEPHADPCLLTVHVALDRDECEHTNTAKTESKNRDGVCATVFSSAQLEILTSGRVQASEHRASAAKRRQMAVFFCYVDSNVVLKPVDNGNKPLQTPALPLPHLLSNPSESPTEITGAEYLERLRRADRHALPEYNITIADLRAHWSLVRQLVEPQPAFPPATSTAFWEGLIERYLFFLACINAAGHNLLDGPPNPPREVRLCVCVCVCVCVPNSNPHPHPNSNPPSR